MATCLELVVKSWGCLLFFLKKIKSKSGEIGPFIYLIFPTKKFLCMSRNIIKIYVKLKKKKKKKKKRRNPTSPPPKRHWRVWWHVCTPGGERWCTFSSEESVGDGRFGCAAFLKHVFLFERHKRFRSVLFVFFSCFCFVFATMKNSVA